jgi:hypothetical protein
VCEHLSCEKVGILERRKVTYTEKHNDLDVDKAMPCGIRKYRKVWANGLFYCCYRFSLSSGVSDWRHSTSLIGNGR